MFLLSHDHMAKRSHYRIMIFYMTFGVLLYGRTPTLIFFYILHHPTTPILAIYVDQRQANLQEYTPQTSCMVQREIMQIPRRTLFAPD